MSKQEVFNYLKHIGCCDVCCLRFFKARGNEYEDVNKTLQKHGINNAEVKKEAGVESEPSHKKVKVNVCVACLGFFDDHFLENLTSSLNTHPDLNKYECQEYVLAITFPILLNVRQLSIWLALLEKFGSGLICNEERPPDVPLKEASKLVVVPRLSKDLRKSYGQNGIMISIQMNHAEETAELENLSKVDKILFRPNGTGKPNRRKGHMKDVVEGITRAYLEKNFHPSNIDSKIYKEHIAVPPVVASTALLVKEIIVTGPTIFVAGRYQKFSRELSHSPWILNGKRIMEDSIQEIIAREVAPYFGVPAEKPIFSSSGREDVDVRCLGKGRPFVLEIPDAKRIILPQSDAENLELDIEKSKKINVINLQIVPREELVHIKTGEEKKQKSYKALCVLQEPATVEIMEKLNIPDGFEIKQWTPIRVLHRRANLERTRKIYSVKAYLDPKNFSVLIIDIVTQAGTYIKELVHGDFNRTDPSFSKIIGKPMEIVALDVTEIDLDWPKDIDNRISAKVETVLT